jgi:hypothetical protein
MLKAHQQGAQQHIRRACIQSGSKGIRCPALSVIACPTPTAPAGGGMQQTATGCHATRSGLTVQLPASQSTTNKAPSGGTTQRH